MESKRNEAAKVSAKEQLVSMLRRGTTREELQAEFDLDPVQLQVVLESLEIDQAFLIIESFPQGFNQPAHLILITE